MEAQLLFKEAFKLDPGNDDAQEEYAIIKNGDSMLLRCM